MRQQIRFCKSADGVSVAHAKLGCGTPLVYAASWLTHLEYDWHSPVRRHWLQAFADEHTLIRYDYRGCGLSARDPEEQSLDAWVGDLLAVVDDLGLEHFPLLGMCHGGTIAAAFAARHPERVTRLVLFGSYLRGGLAPNASTTSAQEAQALARMIEVGWGKDTAAFREVFCKLLIPDAPPEYGRALGELARRTATPASAVKLWRAFHAIDISGEVANVRCPTLVCHVRGDSMVPFAAGWQLASSIAGARFVPLEGHNHILRADEPSWRLFLNETRSFLAEDERAAPDKAFPSLTRREGAVLDELARGLSNNEIAAALFLTPKSVRNYISRIFSKLNVTSRAHAIVLARDAGLGRKPRSEGADNARLGQMSQDCAH
jgi:pimeloyl-ACP methyl ester carboxylesterase/DNA-binding CsgD family transcriptional regulator